MTRQTAFKPPSRPGSCVALSDCAERHPKSGSNRPMLSIPAGPRRLQPRALRSVGRLGVCEESQRAAALSIYVEAFREWSPSNTRTPSMVALSSTTSARLSSTACGKRFRRSVSAYLLLVEVIADMLLGAGRGVSKALDYRHQDISVRWLRCGVMMHPGECSPSLLITDAMTHPRRLSAFHPGLSLQTFTTTMRLVTIASQEIIEGVGGIRICYCVGLFSKIHFHVLSARYSPTCVLCFALLDVHDSYDIRYIPRTNSLELMVDLFQQT